MKLRTIAVLAGGLALVASPPGRAEDARLLHTAPGMAPAQATALWQRRDTATRIRREWLAAGHLLPADGVAPTLSRGKVLTVSLSVGRGAAAPRVRLTYQTGSAGLRSIQLSFRSQTTTQLLETYYTPYYGLPSTAATVTIQQPLTNGGSNYYQPFPASLGNYAAPGMWYLQSATIYDNAGNSTFYDTPIIGSVFSTQTFTATNNGSPDTAAPMVTAGQVLTPTVSLGSAHPVFQATLSAADATSGVHDVAVFLSPPGSANGFADGNLLDSPSKQGVFQADTLINPGYPTGTWTIQGYEACDTAGNCRYDTSAADVQALFGTTTFVVTP